jgi:drug/metabolite transporter (DMT)-like permease
VLILSILGVSIFNTLVYIGLQTTTATNGVLLQSVMPLLILIFSYLIFRERVTRRQLGGLAVSLAGVLVIISRGSVGTLIGLTFAPGDAWIFAAVVCYALYSVLFRRRPAVHPLSLLAVTFGIGAFLLGPFYLWEYIRGARMVLNATTVAAVVYIALVPSVLAFYCFNRAITLIGPNRAGQFLHLMPLFGSLLAFLLLGERLYGYHLAGAVLIGGGILLATVRRHSALSAPIMSQGYSLRRNRY